MKEKKFSSRELSLLCKQLAMILKSGMTLQEGVSLLSEDMSNPQMKAAIVKLEEELTEYKPLHEALATINIFPKHMLHMIEVGFISGKLEEVLDGLSNYYEREYVLKERFKQAILQPILLVGLFLVVLSVIVIKVLPIFNEVFIGLGSKMSGFAMGLMNVGSFIVNNMIWIIIVFLIITGILVYLIWSKKIVLKDSEKMAMAQFTSAIALMLSSGVGLEEAFKQAVPVIYNEKLSRVAESCLEEIEEKKSLIQIMAEKEMLGKWQMRLLSMAYKTGRMDEAMEKIAQTCEEEYIGWIEKWINRIEPSFVIVFSLLIGGLLISVMFPLMSIMSSIG